MNLHTDPAVLLLLFSPLAAAILSLTGKFSSRGIAVTASFFLWIGGTLWGLALSADLLFAAAPIGQLAGQLFGTSAGQLAGHGSSPSASLLYPLGGHPEPFGITMEVNAVTWLATVTDVCIGLAAWLHMRRMAQKETQIEAGKETERKEASAKKGERPKSSGGRIDPVFSFFFFMALFSLQGVLMTRDLFNLFVWFEILSLSSFLLIVHQRNAVAYRAALRYLFMATLSILFFLVGVWIFYRLYGSLALPSIYAGVGRGEAGAAASLPPLAITGLALITAGILTRAAIVPFHTWLPEAHAAAPYPISALLSGFVIKAPVLALWRIYDYLRIPAFGELLIWLGAFCALGGVIAAMVQRDAKKLLGYHSVSQMGYIIAAFGFGGLAGRTAALFYIIAHALFKSILFLTVGEVTDESGSRDVYELRGLGRRFPAAAILFTVGALSISGVPLFAGYTAKLLVSDTLHSHPSYLLLLAAGAGTAASFFKLGRIFTGRAAEPVSQTKPSVSRLQWATFGTAVLAAGCLALGLLPEYFTDLIAGAVRQSSAPVISEGLALSAVISEGLAHSAVISEGLAHSAGAPPVQLGNGGASFVWFGIKPLLKAGLSLAAGFLLSLLLLTKPGRAFSHRLRAYALGINGSLRLLTAGTVAIILFSFLFS